MASAKTNSHLNSVNILGVRVDILDVNSLNSRIEHEIISKEHSLILNVNVNCLNLAYENEWLHDFLNRAKLVFCDGAGVIYGARLLGYSINERITYADWTWQLAQFAEQRGISFFFLGGKPGVAASAGKRLKNKFPNLRITGIHHGYFDKKQDSHENQKVIRMINSVKPDILMVAFGMPLQEEWLMINWDEINVKVALTGGAVFDYVSGELRRPSRWMTDHSLEWLGRLIIEPSRLWKRYLIGNPKFLVRVLKQKYVQVF